MQYNAQLSNIVAHKLCAVCQVVTKNSAIIQTLLSRIDQVSIAELEYRYQNIQRVPNENTDKDRLPFHSIVSLRKSAKKGCHLCTLFYTRSPVSKNLSDCPMHFDATIKDGGMRIEWRGEETNSQPLNIQICSKPDWDFDESFTIRTSKATSVDSIANIIKFWIKNCSKCHKDCNSEYMQRFRSGKCPTRLIDVSNLERPRLIICDNSKAKSGHFVTLSHRWGNKKFLQLTQKHYQEWQRQIPFQKLSRTFQEAIMLTNTLGYQYLWIDALCIIQDSRDDWTREANLMADVYSNGVLNISACGDIGQSECFKTRNPLRFVPCEIAKSERYVLVAYHPNRDVGEPVLLTRGWVFQERVLCQRNVFLGNDELYWECYSDCASECSPRGYARQKGPLVTPFRLSDPKAAFSDLLHRVAKHHQTLEIPPMRNFLSDFNHHWGEVVSLYSETNFTHVHDKLPAIAGIAAVIMQTVSWTYIAGIWKQTLPRGFCWARRWGTRICGRLDLTTAPSWSWISLTSPIIFPAVELEIDQYRDSAAIVKRHEARVLNYVAKEEPEQLKILGKVTEARLEIRGILRPVLKWSKSEDILGQCGQMQSHCSGFHIIFFDFESVNDFIPDRPLAGYEDLAYLSISHICGKEYSEDHGLVLTPYHNGFIRVGYLHLSSRRNAAVQVIESDLLWGRGVEHTIVLY